MSATGYPDAMSTGERAWPTRLLAKMMGGAAIGSLSGLVVLYTLPFGMALSAAIMTLCVLAVWRVDKALRTAQARRRAAVGGSGS
ncbi:MAG: hypothetical protein OXJ90_17760 [Spirochaetaceae bacterium]|nr:hypothetical protein [Spirochaetaceae bacterium]